MAGRITYLMVSTATIISFPHVALAQQADLTAKDSSPGEIVVTAQRKPERLSDVPIAVTAFDNAALDRRQIDAASDLQEVVPNLNFTATNFGGTNFSIRGIGRSVIGDGADSGVAFHFNGAFLQNGGNTNLFYDVGSVEVLRGPQGTLFGRNATGGVINIISQKPLFETSGYAEAGIGSRSTYTVEGAINVAASNTVAFRFAGIGLKSDGDVRDLTSGRRIDGDGVVSLRGSARWQPDSGTTIDLVVSYLRAKSDATQAQKRLCTRDPVGNLGCLPDSLGFDFPNSLATLSGLFANGVGLTSDDYDPYLNAQNPRNLREVALDFTPTAFAREWIATLELEHRFGALKLNALTTYTSDKGSYETDPDFAVADPYLDVPGVFPDGFVPTSAPDPTNGGSTTGTIIGTFNRPYQLERGSSRGREWLQEVRLSSDFDGRFNFLLGGFFLDYNRSEDFFSIANAFDAVALVTDATPPFLRIETAAADLRSYSAFGEAYLKLSPHVRLTGGLRWTRDEKTQVNRSVFLAGLTPFSDNRLTNSGVTGRFVAEWKPEVGTGRSLNIYAGYARGYKGGGFNPQGQIEVPLTFRPETIDSIEGGVKYASRALSVNFAAFHYNYRDLQVSKVVNLTSVNENIDAKILGAELEASLNSGGFSVDGALSYLRSRIGDTTSIDPRDPTGGAPDLIAVKDTVSAGNCVATLDQLATVLGGVPFGDCAALGLADGVAVNLRGKRLANAPKWSARLGVQYSKAIGGDWTGTIRADWNWRGDFWGRIFNRNPVDRIAGWSAFNAQAEIDWQQRRFFAKLDGKNLFNKIAVTGLFLGDATSGLPTNIFLLPARTISLTIGTRF
jgi:iron complex outermembrane recepter protein